MNAEDLVKLYERSQQALELNLREITPADSLRQPPGGANTISWVLGHLLASRRLATNTAGGEPLWDRETAEIYSGDEEVTFDPTRALPFERLLADLRPSHDRLVAALSALTPEALATPLRNNTVGGFLAFLAYHEGYHCGQLGLLRRFVGKAGAIKQPKRLGSPQ